MLFNTIDEGKKKQLSEKLFKKWMKSKIPILSYAEIGCLFKACDTDDDGVIRHDDLTLNLLDTQTSEIQQQVDKIVSEKLDQLAQDINYDEFHQLLRALDVEMPKKESASLFQMLAQDAPNQLNTIHKSKFINWLGYDQA